jgi:hypothetical protein
VIDLLKKQYADYSGQLFNRPEITILPGEGRSSERIDHSYELIQYHWLARAASSGGFYSISKITFIPWKV